jgi:hypothetical protein
LRFKFGDARPQHRNSGFVALRHPGHASGVLRLHLLSASTSARTLAGLAGDKFGITLRHSSHATCPSPSYSSLMQAASLLE